MNDTLIINGITYKAVKEEKKPERLERFVDNQVIEILGVGFASNAFKSKPKCRDTTRMIELRSGEIIVNEYDVKRALHEGRKWISTEAGLLHHLGFKKDGAE